MTPGLLTPGRKESCSGDVVAPPACRFAARAGAAETYVVRNTFIEVKLQREPSLEHFFEARRCRSSPTSRAASRSPSPQVSQERLLRRSGGLRVEDPLNIATPTGSCLPTPRGPHTPHSDGALPERWEAHHAALAGQPGALPVLRLAGLISDAPGATAAAAAAKLTQELARGAVLVPSISLGQEGGSSVCSTAASSAQGSALMAHWRAFSDSASSAGSGVMPASPGPLPAFAGGAASRLQGQPRLGTSEMPTRGSALHSFGTCKPCAFVFQDGCKNGLECEYCHLCDFGESKRRKKVKKLEVSWRMHNGCRG